MQLESIKALVALGWVTAASLAGLAFNLNSPATWLALAGVALLPPAVMFWRWNEPAQTMSESIHEARR